VSLPKWKEKVNLTRLGILNVGERQYSVGSNPTPFQNIASK